MVTVPNDIYDVDLTLERHGEDLRVTLRHEGGTTWGSDRYDRVHVLVGMRPRWVAHDLADRADRLDLTSFRAGLGQALFPPDVADVVETLLGTHDRVRIWIRAAGEEKDRHDLAALPWEAANPSFLGGKRALTDEERISVFRRSEARARPLLPIEGDRLRVSYVVGDLTIDGERELGGEKGLKESLDALGGLDLTTRRKLKVAELDALLESANVLHYSGHATHQHQRLVLNDDGQRAVEVGPGQLNDHVRSAKALRLAVLAACGTGTTSTTHATWADLEVDVVVAMQRDVSDLGATEFTRALYTELAESADLDLAVARGRAALREHEVHEREDHTVVVYSRCPGGRIDLRPRAPEADAEPVSEAPRSSKPGLRRPRVRWQPADAPEEKLSRWLDKGFKEAARLNHANPRQLTPYLGPGVLQTDPTVEQILWDSQLEARMEADPALGAFVRPLLATRKRGRTEVTVTPERPVELAVSALRGCLAKLAERATAEFVEASLRDAIPLNLWERHQVPTSDLPATMDAMTEAIEATKAVSMAFRADGREDTLLGASRLTSRLEQLLVDLTTGGEFGLSGAGVAWLTDLFWHAVTFDSPLYPQIEELSLQVSLLAGQKDLPIRSLDPAAVVARTELGKLSEATAHAIERGFEASEAYDGKRRRLYRALAAILHAEYGRWDPTRMDARDQVIPMALSTTWDLELERGLAASGRSYEVAIPIYTRVERSSDDGRAPSVEESVRWLVGRFDPVDDPTIEDLATPASGWRPASSIQALKGAALDLHGPLVLKLNGSPCHALPDDTADLGLSDRADGDAAESPAAAGHRSRFGRSPGKRGTKTAVSIEHAVSLGEYDFLQVTRMSQYSFDRSTASANDEDQNVPHGLPDCLVNEVTAANRYWLLLGHRFSDWTSRTQIHTFIAHESQHTERGCAVANRFDTDRLLFLDWLGITRTKGEMAELIEPLEDAADLLSRPVR